MANTDDRQRSRYLIIRAGARFGGGGAEAKYFQNYSIWKKNYCKSYLNANKWNYKGKMRQLLI